MSRLFAGDFSQTEPFPFCFTKKSEELLHWEMEEGRRILVRMLEEGIVYVRSQEPALLEPQ